MHIYMRGRIPGGRHRAVDRAADSAPVCVGGYQIKPQQDNMGRWYFPWGDEAMTTIGHILPDPIAELAESFSLLMPGIWIGRRLPGVYRHETAEGEVHLNTESPVWFSVNPLKEGIHTFHITGPNLNHCQELFQLIMTGKIVPETSWLEPQITTPKPDL